MMMARHLLHIGDVVSRVPAWGECKVFACWLHQLHDAAAP
jgi:hypothetical protein